MNNKYDLDCPSWGIYRDTYDENDYIYESQFKIQTPDYALPKDFDLLYKTPIARTQGKLGACASFVGCSARSMLDSDRNIVFSPAFLYHFSCEQNSPDCPGRM